ncbi:threonine/homoserine efflux transporter RhtA [Mumia flava]|uniref:Threonine/homoserine efflux transporter RhtA n=1 Tax=Mumia flava TaxID=1348852 RepID=A0A0B2BN50_9ACTN|nr:EamA family transporter [Mumia flava]PJJ57930.1 threonine/homoserine efflux transporter RhtA [Mumia flava]
MARTHSSPGIGYALVVAGALFFIVNAGVSRVALRAGVDPALLTTLRTTGSAAVLALVVLFFDRRAFRIPRGRELLMLVVLGVVGVAGVQWTYNIAIDRIPVGMALLLEYLAPVLVVLWAKFVQKQDVKRTMWLAVAFSLTGLALVAQIATGLAFDGIGMLAGLGAAVCFSVYFLVGEYGVHDSDPVRVMLWAFVFAGLAMNLVAPVWNLSGVGLGADADLLGALSGITVPLWAVLAWIVVLGSLTPFFLELAALQHLPATVVTMVATLEPVGAAALGWVWFGESLDALQVFGGLLVIVGILIAQTARPAPTPAVPEVGG